MVLMEDVVKVASYICQRYMEQFGSRIGEMKLHKLLYFTQRECIVQTEEPMFPDKFEAWKYGPVMVKIRKCYGDDTLNKCLSDKSIEKYKSVFDNVFETFALKDAWSLSTLTHGEYSWKNARRNYGKEDACSIEIETSDIKKDAIRIRNRRFLLKRISKVNKPA